MVVLPLAVVKVGIEIENKRVEIWVTCGIYTTGNPNMVLICQCVPKDTQRGTSIVCNNYSSQI